MPVNPEQRRFTGGKILLAWSGGKDGALALHEIRKSGQYEIAALLTTVTREYDRISMHGVRRALLEAQAASVGLPLEEVFISPNASNEEYEANMRAALEKYKARGVSGAAFGDIFLEDLRKYREENLAKMGIRGVFPLWKRDTAALAREFVRLGFKAIVTCVDTKMLDGKFAGRLVDESFFADLPAGVDPCGENGEYHSFVFAGPLFSREILFTKGEVVLRENRFLYCDLIPA